MPHSTLARFQLSWIIDFMLLDHCEQFLVLIFSLLVSWIKSTVTGEHTCMVLKPLNNDEIEASESAQWGFFGPFYQGEVFTFRSAITLCYMRYLIMRL